MTGTLSGYPYVAQVDETGYVWTFLDRAADDVAGEVQVGGAWPAVDGLPHGLLDVEGQAVDPLDHTLLRAESLAQVLARVGGPNRVSA